MNVGDPVRVVRVYGNREAVLPGFVLATSSHKRLRHVEGSENFEVVDNDDDDHSGVVDMTNAPTPDKGCVHVAHFTMEGRVRVEQNVPTTKARGKKLGIWVEAL